MAEGDASQNQGQKGQNDLSKEVKSEAADPKKLERAAKERERRRRRRRKKAELRRLAKEAPGPVPSSDEVPQKKPRSKSSPPKSEQPKKTGTAPVPSGEPQMPRSEEPVARSKNIVPQAEPEKESVPGEQKNVEHPMAHKTHSFAGPLIQPKQPTKKEEPREEPVSEPEPQPVSQPVTEPEPESVVEPEPTPEPVQSIPEPEPEPAPAQPSQPPSEDIVIRGEHEDRRPQVEMRQPHPEEEEEVHEVPSIFPEDEEEPTEVHPPEQHTEEPEQHNEEVPAEVIESAPHEEVKPGEQKVHEQPEQNETSKELLEGSEGLQERKPAWQSAGSFFSGFFKNVGSAILKFRLKFDFRKLGVFVVLVILGGALYAGYVFKVHEKVYNYVAGFFKAPVPVEINVDEELLREWGITTALVFGDNRGNSQDLLASQIYNAYYFGFLKEPKVQGETGITPAYYYGTGADQVAQTNQFIDDISNLRELVSLYDVDVYRMLDQTTDREKALDGYVTKLHATMDKSQTISDQLKTEIDDLKVSYDSLTPDKTQFESDFFTALQGLAGEKSDFLLKSFIDVTQKQAALKARYSALQQLATYYDSAMQKLSVRITAVEQNHQALVQGIHVVDIPGANLDIILQSNQ